MALWVVSGDENGGTMEDVNAGGMYALPQIIRDRAAWVRPTCIALSDPEVVETRTVETRVFACRLSAVRNR